MQKNIALQKKFDKKYLFLEYNLATFLSWRNQSKNNYFAFTNLNSSNKKISGNKNINLSSFLTLIETSIQKDFILINNVWTFFKIYSKPRLVQFFPDRRSFFCYWLFPFIGFITITSFSEVGKVDLLLKVNSIHNSGFAPNNNLLTNLNHTQLFSKLNWEAIEYLNYKKFIGNNSFSPNKQEISKQNSTFLTTSMKHNFRDNLDNKLSSPSDFQIVALHGKEINVVYFKNNLNTLNSEQKQNLDNLCKLYLKETSSIIYKKNLISNSLDFSSPIKKATRQVDYINKNNIEKPAFNSRNNAEKELIFKSTGFDKIEINSTFNLLNNQSLKEINFTETILGNYFTRKSSFNFYWYVLNLNKGLQYFKLKNTKLISLKHTFKEKKKKVQMTWLQLDEFPTKLLPFNCLDNLSTHFNKSLHTSRQGKTKKEINIKKTSKNSFKKSSETNNIKKLLNSKNNLSFLQTLMDVEFKKEQIEPNFFDSSKNSDKFKKIEHPIMCYKNSSLILNNILDKFHLDLGIKLEQEKLQRLFLNELDANSTFLYHLKKLLINSKINTKKEKNSIWISKPENLYRDNLYNKLSNPSDFQILALQNDDNFKTESKSTILSLKKFNLAKKISNSTNSKPNYFLKNSTNEFNLSYKLTKNYLNLILIKKLVMSWAQSLSALNSKDLSEMSKISRNTKKNISKNLLKISSNLNEKRASDFQILGLPALTVRSNSLYTIYPFIQLKRNLGIIRHNNFIKLNKSISVKNLLNNSKIQTTKFFILSHLNSKFNQQLGSLIKNDKSNNVKKAQKIVSAVKKGTLQQLSISSKQNKISLFNLFNSQLINKCPQYSSTIFKKDEPIYYSGFQFPDLNLNTLFLRQHSESQHANLINAISSRENSNIFSNVIINPKKLEKWSSESEKFSNMVVFSKKQLFYSSKLIKTKLKFFSNNLKINRQLIRPFYSDKILKESNINFKNAKKKIKNENVLSYSTLENNWQKSEITTINNSTINSIGSYFPTREGYLSKKSKNQKFRKTKFLNFSNELDSNNLEHIIHSNLYNKLSSGAKPKGLHNKQNKSMNEQSNFKNYAIWYKNKPKNLNLMQNKVSDIMLLSNKILNKNSFSSTYYVNKTNFRSFNKLSLNIIPTTKVMALKNQKILHNKKNSLSLQKKNDILKEFVNYLKRVGNELNTKYFLNFNSKNFEKSFKIIESKTFYLYLINYVKFMSNKLKSALSTPKVYILKILSRKKLTFKNFFQKNFYLRINQNKQIYLKKNPINSNSLRLQHKDKLVELDDLFYKSKKKYFVKKSFKKSITTLLQKNHIFSLNSRPPIEKIFRNYLSSKYTDKKITQSLNSRKKTFKNSTSYKNLKHILQNQHLYKMNFSNFMKKPFRLKRELKMEGIPNRINFSSEKKILKKITSKSKKLSLLNNFEKKTQTKSNVFNDSERIIKFIKTSQLNRSHLSNNLVNSNLIYSIKTPYNLIKKIGFIFFNKGTKVFINTLDLSLAEKEIKGTIKNFELKYLKKNIKKQNLVKRLEKSKNLQKKRRRKKQARENRRRKKRKRFYPRPIWLRFLLYKKFIKLRHLTSVSKSNSYFQKNLRKKRDSSVYQLGLENKYINKNNLFANNYAQILAQTKYKRFFQNQSVNKTYSIQNQTYHTNFYNLNLENKTLRANIYRTNKQNWGNIFLDIPNSEKVIIKKQLLIQSLPIFADTKLYDLSTNLLNDFKKIIWKSYWLRSNFNPYINRVQNYLTHIKKYVSEFYVFNSLKQFLLEIVGINLKENSLTMNVSLQYPMSGAEQQNSNEMKVSSPQNLDFENLETLNQNSTNDKFVFFNATQKNYSPLWYLNVRRNFTNFSGIPNGYTYLASSNLIQFNRILSNRIQFIMRNIKTNLNAEGYSESRAFNPGRTKVTNVLSQNFLTNVLKDWWIDIENFWNISFSVINIPQETYLNQAKFRILWALNKTNVWSFKPNTSVNLTWNKSKVRDKNKSNKTKKMFDTFINNLENTNRNNIARSKLIDKMFLRKWNYSNQKIKQLGFLVTDKNLQTLSKTSNIPLNKKISNLILKENLTTYFTKHQKNFLHFWWSEQNWNNYNFFQTDLSFKSEVDFFNSEKNMLGINIITFWGCLLLFHLCILFSLLNIGGIRTFIKFQMLCVYKLTNIYLTIIYSTFIKLKQIKTNLLMYSNIVSSLFQNIKTKKQSFLLVSLNSNKVQPFGFIQDGGVPQFDPFQSNIDGKTEKLGQLIIYNEGKFMLLNNFEKSILKSFNRYNAKIININLYQNFNHFKNLITIQNHKIKQNKFVTLKQLRYFSIINSSILLPKNNSFNMNNRFSFVSTSESRGTSLENTNKNLNVSLVNNLSPSSDNTYSLKLSQLFLYNTTKILLTLTKLRVSKIIFNVKDVLRSNNAFLLISKYIQIYLCLSIFWFFKILLKLSNKSFIGMYIILFKLMDILEGIMLIIYKFLEKPAELMIDFISEFFLIEWSSDIVSFMPESLDMYASATYQKLIRNFRNFGFNSFFWHRRFLSFLDIFLDRLTKPDIDLIIRQKKGIIFWDIWAEILVQAAEIYNINLSSLINIKEEQDLFFEKLLNDKTWNWSNSILSKMSPLMDLIKTSEPDGLKNNWILFSKSEQIWRRWAVNPYYTYQGKDTDLFVEIHPPKSFTHFKLMKYYPPIFEPVGSVVCQIYSGTFVKQVSKNLLLVGSPGSNKSLLLQAIAGETELKIMMDNANRYSLTLRGVAIGMKLLKDVFDALALQAPCLFIIEDIHLIGERRPMLISDDENIKGAENSFGVEQEEIHEKNQVIYQLSRHSIVHYKKPYKGDFSLLIPTNHFSLDFFLGFSPPKTRLINQVPQNPFPIKAIEQELAQQNSSEKTLSFGSTKNKLKLTSQLQLSKKEVFTPPSTSPITILLLKEQKKVKPKKIVSQMPWGGLSSDQLMQLPKSSYSVRVKVALLADIAIRNLSVKLDRITDLLIIIDSVRSHRGFVVVATTHIPSILDPALRRPGRFDETLTIPSLPNLWSRWEILKASVSDFSSTLDLVDLSQLFNNLNENELSVMISKTKLFLLTKRNVHPSVNKKIANNKNLTKTTYINSFEEALQSTAYPFILDPFEMDLKRKKAKENYELLKNQNLKKYEFVNSKNQILSSHLKKVGPSLSIFKTSTNCLSISYFQISKWLISTQLLKDQTSYQPILSSNLGENSVMNLDSSSFTGISTSNQTENISPFAIYNSQANLKNQLLKLFAGKVGEFFAFYDIKFMAQLVQNKSYNKENNSKLINSQPFWNNLESINTWQYSTLINSYGIDQTWRRASNLIFSIIYKKCLYNKNILIYRLFNLQSFKSLRQAPSPPNSAILIGPKRYENYKRIEMDFQNRITFSVHEKIQKHQHQRFIKTLYNQPIQKYFRSELTSYKKSSTYFNKSLTSFETCFRELSLIDTATNFQSKNKSSRLTSINLLFNNRINIRHRFYLTNQWWNTQLPEHNSETTFLSEIDWRYMFIDSVGDLWMDFPDTDQHYNPRNRQWMLNSGYWSYWYNFDKVMTQEIYYQFVIESFYKAYNFLDTSREILDLTCYKFLTSAILKEIDFITYFKRFYLAK